MKHLYYYILTFLQICCNVKKVNIFQKNRTFAKSGQENEILENKK